MIPNLQRAPSAHPSARHWTACPDADYKQSLIYRGTTSTFGSATLIDAVKASAFVDDALTPGTPYFYWVAHQDSSGNISSVSPMATATPTKILAGDYEAGSIATADVAALAITSPLISTDAVIPSKLFPQDQTNLVRDPEMLETGNFGVAGTGATLTRVQNSWPFGGSRFMMKVQTTAGVGQLITGADIPVEGSGLTGFGATTPIIVDCIMSPRIDTTPVVAVQVYTAYVDWYPTDTSGNPGTLISTSTVVLATVAGFADRYAAIFTPPAGAQVARLRLEGKDLATPANAVTFYVASIHIRRQLLQNDMALNSVNSWQAAGTNGTINCNAGVHKQVEQVVSDQNITGRRQVNFLEIVSEFRNNSGGARTMDITVEGDASGTVYRTWPSIVLQEGNFWTGEIQIDAPAEFVFNTFVTMVTSGTVTRTRMASKVRYS
jgi:hypothetical protein